MFPRDGAWLRTGEAEMLTCSKRADDGLRTRDLQLGKLALYQLSYVRVGGYFSTLVVALVT
jgi:hypothetical protein